MLAVGAEGVVSVVANLVPRDVIALIEAFQGGRIGEARERHARLFPLCRDLLGLAPNPIPVKAALALLGRGNGEVRLPLCPLDDRSLAILTRSLIRYGLLTESRHNTYMSHSRPHMISEHLLARFRLPRSYLRLNDEDVFTLIGMAPRRDLANHVRRFDRPMIVMDIGRCEADGGSSAVGRPGTAPGPAASAREARFARSPMAGPPRRRATGSAVSSADPVVPSHPAAAIRHPRMEYDRSRAGIARALLQKGSRNSPHGTQSKPSARRKPTARSRRWARRSPINRSASLLRSSSS